MTASPISITAPARAEFHAHPGQTVTVPMRVQDTGHSPVRVTVTDASITTLASEHPAAAWITSMTPQSFTLQPGQSATVTVTISIPKTARGQHAANIMFRAAPVTDPAGSVQTMPAVGSSLVVDLPGHDTDPAAAGVVVHPAAPASFPVMPVAGGGSAVLVAACAAVLVRRRLRPRGRHA